MTTNRYAAQCNNCGLQVSPGDGLLKGKDPRGRWITIHSVCPTEAQATAPVAAENSDFAPTAEQAEALALFRTGRALVIEAGAGAGKTSTLKLLAADAHARGLKGQYTAFNKKIVTSAKGKFTPNVNINTFHSLAYAAVGKAFSHRFEGTRIRNDQVARHLHVDPFIYDVDGERKVFQPSRIGGLILRSLVEFASSVDPEPTERHVPYVDGLDTPDESGRRTYENNRQLARHIAPALKAAWKDLSDPNGTLPYNQSYYVKLWQLGEPFINADFILFDEAQDADPVQLDIILRQTHAQLVFVGDSQQSIYGWRGAVDALAKLRETDCEVATLTKSFRFGAGVAEVANTILARLNAELRIEGFEKINSVVGPVAEPAAILCRTNASAVTTVLSERAAGRRAALVGGAGEIIRFAKAAERLQRGESTDHPELSCFDNWAEVQAYVQGEEGSDLRLSVKLVDTFGVPTILSLDKVEDENATNVDVVVSTAHKAKGLEWSSVRLAADFRAPKNGAEIPAEELRLLYVAVTRAQYELDIEDASVFATFGVTTQAAPEAEEIDRTENASILAAAEAQESAISKLLRGE